VKERRRHERISEQLQVRVICPGCETQIGKTRDFSASGTFLEINLSSPPEPGTMIELQLDAPVDGGAAPVLKARVVRILSNGLGLEFL